MGFTEAVQTCFSKYVTFSGRARRSEYWYFVLFGIITTFALSLVDTMFFGSDPDSNQPLSSLFSLIILLPYISVMVRRLHDTNHSGWWYWLWLIPLIGWIILLVWYVSKGTTGPNDYGEDPFDDWVDDDRQSYTGTSSIPKISRKD